MKCPLCNGTGECDAKPTSRHKKDVAKILVENGWSYSEIASVLGWKSKNSVQHALKDTILSKITYKTPDTETEELVKLNRTCGCTLGWCTECLKWKGVIEIAVASRDTYWKEKVEELELSCIDDRLLGKTAEYLDGYNTSTERWREQRDALLDNMK